MLRVIGLMSGTSLDGVDAAWLETDGVALGRMGPALTLPYDDALRRDMRRLLDRAAGLPRDDAGVAEVAHRLTLRHVEAVRALGMEADLIGFHGQTILHQPHLGTTWQIGDAALLARECNTPVAYDFRSADMAAGGQGAPLVPVFHAALAAGMPGPVAVLNIGGVANVSWVSANHPLVAFDTGPGNGTLDDWVNRHTGQAYDDGGALSLSGTVDEDLLARLMAHPYFSKPAPKSLDRLDFAGVLDGVNHLSAADGAASLAAFTARAVAAAPLPAPPVRWLVCGGGRHNAAIMAALRACLGVPVDPVEDVGWNGDALEAQCFGFLAARTRAGLPITFPSTTGCPAPLPGGRIVAPGEQVA